MISLQTRFFAVCLFDYHKAVISLQTRFFAVCLFDYHKAVLLVVYNHLLCPQSWHCSPLSFAVVFASYSYPNAYQLGCLTGLFLCVALFLLAPPKRFCFGTLTLCAALPLLARLFLGYNRNKSPR